MRTELKRFGTPAPRVIGIDELSIKKGHKYRIIVSDLIRRRAIWFGCKDRKKESMDMFYDWLGSKKSKKIQLAVMDMWKAFANSAEKNIPHADILYDKFNVMKHLGEALDSRSGLAAYCKPKNKEIPLDFVERLNNKIRVMPRRAYGLEDEEYLRLKVFTCCLPEILFAGKFTHTIPGRP